MAGDAWFQSQGHTFYGNDDRLHDYYAASGRVASCWAHIEFTMDALIWEMTEGAESRMIPSVTAQFNGVAPRLRAIIALLRLRGAPEGPKTIIKRLNKFQGGAVDLVKIRNRAVHDLWVMRDDGVAHQFCVAVPDKVLAFGLVPRSIDALNDDFQKIEVFRREFNTIQIDVRAWLRTLPEKWHTTLPSFLVPDPQP